MSATTYHPGRHRVAAIRQLLEQRNADPAKRIRVTFSGDEAVLEGEADCFADKEAALSATLLLGEAAVVTDRVRVRVLSADRIAGTGAQEPAGRVRLHR